MYDLICEILKTIRISQNTENRLMVARSGSGGCGGEIDEEGQKVQTSSYKMKKLWRFNVHHSDYS